MYPILEEEEDPTGETPEGGYRRRKCMMTLPLLFKRRN
jgi:hypothetical protein